MIPVPRKLSIGRQGSLDITSYSHRKGDPTATHAERQKAYRERKREKGMRDSLYFVTDDQDRFIGGFLAKGSNSKHDSVSTGPGAAMVDARDKLSAIRQRTEDAEKRYRSKEDGSPLRFWGIWQKFGEKWRNTGRRTTRKSWTSSCS